MLKACQTLKRTHLSTTKRLLSSQARNAASGRAQAARSRRLLYVATSAVGAGTLWHLSQNPIYNDAYTPEELARAAGKPTGIGADVMKDGSLHTLVWGSNRAHTLSYDQQVPESVRTPAVADWLDGVALRDLVLHENHAACIDAKGDVYQWGDGFFGAMDSTTHPSSSGKPALTLRGKNIVSLQATSDRIFALSASGRIYVLSSKSSLQKLAAGAPTPSSTPWWGTGWIWGEEEDVDFAEITSNEKMGWSEKFVSISAGDNHLLALTSGGRTFAHPINMKANTFGQLGFRKFDVPDRPLPSGHAHPHPARVGVELTPKSVSDPYANASRPRRQNAEEPSTVQPDIDDSGIRFSDKLFEIPALKGINVGAIAAGSRSSFAKSSDGRVLGWGANQFGQIGLGGNITLEAITVPTEIILWRSTPQTMRTTCLDVYAGGDLTFFKVERTDGSALPYIDVLACGNGQYGGLGNAQYSNGQGLPVRTKNVSGLLEYSEKTNNMQPIYPHDISISPTGHVLLTLDTRARSGPGGSGGRDLLAWGANQEYQLGNGKRGSSAAPQALHAPDGQRFMLAQRKAEVKDMSGRVWKKGAVVEQCAVAGWGNSVVYWKIVR